MPQLLQINSCISGSTGSIAQYIGELAISNGWESWIAYSGRENEVPSKSHLIPIGSKFESILHAVQTRFFDNHGLSSKHATQVLIRQIKEIKPDIIHLHNIHGYYLNIEILFNFLSKNNIPVVWTLHDCWAFTGHCVHYTDVKCNKWKNNSVEHCSKCPKKTSYPTSVFLDKSARNYKLKKSLFTSVNNMTIVPVSKWLGSVISDSFLNKYPIKPIQNGIDINTFYPRPDSITNVRMKYGLGDKFIILGVAKGWSKDVGLHDFYRLRELLDERFTIVMVGLTNKQIEELPAGITGISHTSNHSELAEIYSTTDIFFNGSFQETFGLVTAEAMACGTPVIVYDSTACPEIVTPQTGFKFKVGHVDSIASTIIKLADCESRSVINENCVKYIHDNLDKNIKYQEYLVLYNSLI